MRISTQRVSELQAKYHKLFKAKFMDLARSDNPTSSDLLKNVI